MKALLISSCIILCSLYSFSCDVCGTSFTSVNSEIYPGVLRNYVGIKSSYALFHGHYQGVVKSSSVESTWSNSLEARFNILKDFYITGTLPYIQNTETIENSDTRNHGIGDFSVKIDYVIPFKDSSLRSNSMFLLGSKLKLPTGKYQNIEGEGYIARSLMTGTGSWDYSFYANYIQRFNTVGYIFGASYAINTTNSLQYKKGNGLAANGTFFKTFKKNKAIIVPAVSIHYYHFQQDIDYRFMELNPNSGGYIFAMGVGNTLQIKDFNLGTSVKVPIAQSLSSNNTKNKIQAEISLRYNI